LTVYRFEHAVVMDTDDLRGRGGYAVVGMSDGLEQAERVFVSQNFGISDFLHDPQNQRTFYSFFRVPGGRRALVRRFARGHRRNQTQNRIFVHTLFIGDDLFDALEGLPWLLIQANLRAVGSEPWDVLKDDLPWLVVDAPLPALEANVDAAVTGGLSERIAKRLAVIDRQLGPTAVPAVLTALRHQGRVTLPQGAALEHLTMLAWSMLPRPDREEMAWTQHDAQNIAGVAFPMANLPEAEPLPLDGPIDALAKRIAGLRIASDDARRELDERTLKYGLTIRRSEEIESWLAWRDALGGVKENIRADDEKVLAYLKTLERTARRQHDDPWIDGEEVLQILWNNVPAAIATGEKPLEAVQRWAHLLRDSGLNAIIFREPPDPRWLGRAAAEVGADLLVRFFIFGTDKEPAAAPVRDGMAGWVLQEEVTLEPETLVLLALRLAIDRSALRARILELLLTTDEGLVAASRLTPIKIEFATFAFDATEIAIREGHEHAPAFIAAVLIPLLDLSPRTASRITPTFAEAVTASLREEPAAWIRFAAHLQPEVVVTLNETITRWMLEEPRQTAGLARAILPRILTSAGAAGAGPLAFALARAGEPAQVWFGVLLERAAAIDTRGDRSASRDFEDAVLRLRSSSPRLDGAFPLLLRLLETAAATKLRIGDCVRALILLLRPAWTENPRALIGAVDALVRQTRLAKGWEGMIEAVVADFGRAPKLHTPVSSLVIEYWLTVAPETVPNLGEDVVRTIAIVDEKGRRRLANEWQTRLRRLPESDSTRQLLRVLFPELGAGERELRIALRQREIEQGIATHATLNGLDKDLHDSPKHRYPGAMSEAIVRHVSVSQAWGARGWTDGTYGTNETDETDESPIGPIGPIGPIRPISRLIELLEASDIAQTVKLVIETILLPRAMHDLKAHQWNELVPELSRVFTRGIPTMSVGYELGLAGPKAAQSAFASACRASRRVDGLQALGEGRRRRGVLQRAMRLMGKDQPLVAQR